MGTSLPLPGPCQGWLHLSLNCVHSCHHSSAHTKPERQQTLYSSSHPGLKKNVWLSELRREDLIKLRSPAPAQETGVIHLFFLPKGPTKTSCLPAQAVPPVLSERRPRTSETLPFTKPADCLALHFTKSAPELILAMDFWVASFISPRFA